MVRFLKSSEGFKAGYVYLSDYAGNISGPYKSSLEASQESVAGDVVLIAINPNKNTKVIKTVEPPKKKINKIVLDFKTKTVIIEGDTGAEVTMDKLIYGVGTWVMEYSHWEAMLADAYRAGPVTIIGQPPIEGENLDEMLHMQ